jgi:hypothetical protein
MKNAISYYYNLNAVDIHQSNKQYRFMADGNYYSLIPYARNMSDVNSIFELSNILISRGIPVHQIIPDNNRNVVTVINNIPYIMFKVHINEKDNVTLNDIKYFSNLTEEIKVKIPNSTKWSELWSNKIDYLEYQISEMGANHPLIRESFSYFVGMGETAIQLFNQISKSNKQSISHFRITGFNNLFDLYNPLDLIIDYKVRDACEFLKYGFFYMNYNFDDIKEYLSTINTEDWPLFITRMLFPTFYFDIYEEIINNNIEDKRLIVIISKINTYEKLLKKTYTYIKQYVIIPDIEWLQKT